jgi:NAD(P)-dependent dehydrogenase (short-subunit alcohol dehydrogenase family)
MVSLSFAIISPWKLNTHKNGWIQPGSARIDSCARAVLRLGRKQLRRLLCASKTNPSSSREAAGKIGKAYAIGFAKEGAKVALPDIASADHVVKAIRDMGGTAISMACDVADKKSVKAMVDEVARQFGTIDVLVNNAAYFMTVKKSVFWEMEVDEFDKAMAVNVRGSWLCARAAFPHMKRQGKGKIINISSGTALNGGQNYIHYVTSKGALIAMTRAMAKELGDYNICVNTVSPGFVVTEGRAVDPAFNASRVAGRALKRTQVENDLVGTVMFLASSESDFMTGQLLNVDGGAHFVG